ncbi:MAG: sensor histidine kinase [Eisenbergiella sp.]
MVSLKRELDFVTCYLTIQQTFEEQLQYTLEAEPDLLEFRLPKLIIQPLVENAVRHAMEEMTDVCTITIRAYRDGDNAYIEVANNGSVFPDNLLEKLVDGSVQAEGFGIGLINIDQRLRLTYGKGIWLSCLTGTALQSHKLK